MLQRVAPGFTATNAGSRRPSVSRHATSSLASGRRAKTIEPGTGPSSRPNTRPAVTLSAPNRATRSDSESVRGNAAHENERVRSCARTHDAATKSDTESERRTNLVNTSFCIVRLTPAILLRRDHEQCGTRAQRASRFRSVRRQQQLLVSSHARESSRPSASRAVGVRRHQCQQARAAAVLGVVAGGKGSRRARGEYPGCHRPRAQR